jgi:hypothetical protein
MKDLWLKTWKLFRGHWIILWTPFVCAEFVNLGRKQFISATVKVIFKWLATSHSVLGGSYNSPDLYSIQRKALLLTSPISLATQFLTACGYVVALVLIAKLAKTIREEKAPEMSKTLAEIATQWRDILLFSLKFCVVFGALAWAGTVALIPLLVQLPRLRELLSHVFLPALDLAVVGCVAWLLIPAAFRLIQDRGTNEFSGEERKLGTIFVVLGSAVSLGLGEVFHRVESGFTITSKAEWTALSAVNIALIHLPEALAFIALALLALQSVESTTIQPDPDDSALPLDSLIE